MENNNSTLSSMFTFSDCTAAIGRQYSRLCGSSRSYTDDLESSGRSPDRRRSSPPPTSRHDTRGPDSRGPSIRHPHPPVSSQAQPYHRPYPDGGSRTENRTAHHSMQLPRYQQDTHQPMKYPIPSPSTHRTSANPRGFATSSRLSSSSSQIPRRPNSSQPRVLTSKIHSHGTQDTGARLNLTTLGPNSYAHVSPDVSTRPGTAGSVANYQPDSSRYGKEHV
ncbi:hypothetical protein BELL_0661g00030 [Botrytis elliptica]|uniref:Uncharacterized protein n=1 Tax=Botrytis elliptica TaxID=278938 RepID=A0A4Z1JB21_9HELO|nr:hypothetical protein BELL_0661g00030 [Botrytis elliptica]